MLCRMLCCAVQAEYLKELEGRAKGVFAELAKQEA